MDWDLVRLRRASGHRKQSPGLVAALARAVPCLGSWEWAWRKPLLYGRKDFYVAICLANLVRGQNIFLGCLSPPP